MLNFKDLLSLLSFSSYHILSYLLSLDFRYCYICRLIKPDRSHHCSSCGFCVLKFDHHCPWINKCISNSNYKYFLLYLFYGCCLIIWLVNLFIRNTWNLKNHPSDGPIWLYFRIFLSSSECLIRYFISEIAISLLEITMIILLMLICIVFGFYPFGELMIYHIRLVSLNETTCEQEKPPIIK